MAVNLLPAHVPIGYVNGDINQPIYASAELTRALTTMMQQIGGQSTSGPGEVTNLAATGISQGIRVTATLPANNTLAYLEAWVSSDAIIGNAVLEAQSQGLQASWDWVPLSSADGVKYIWIRCISKSGKAGAFVGPVSAEAGLTTVPGAVTGLSATPIIGGIRIAGTLPVDLDLAYVEIWENTVNNVNTATFLDQGLKSSYDRLNLLASAGTRYYWVRCVNTSGAKGAFVGPVSAIAGQVQSGNIASGAVQVAAFASGIEPVTIVSSVPGTLSTKTIFNTTNGKLYKWNGSAYIATTPTTDLSGQIAAGQIAANAVTAGTIAANAVTAGTIAAGAVSASQISVTQLSAIVANLGTVTAGNINGTANIDIAGQATFGGAFTAGSGDNAAADVNPSGTATNGMVVHSGTGGSAILAIGGGTGTSYGVQATYLSGSSGAGVLGTVSTFATGGTGVKGLSLKAAGIGVEAVNGFGGTALSVQGKMTLDNSTFTWNSKTIAAPTGSTTTFLRNDGTWATPAGAGVSSVSASSSTGGLTLASSGGSTPAITLSGTPTAATQISNGGHTYTFSGGSVTGTGTATFSSANKPGASTSNIWLTFVIDGSTYYTPAWPA
jgi:hypothetical protein